MSNIPIDERRLLEDFLEKQAPQQPAPTVLDELETWIQDRIERFGGWDQKTLPSNDITLVAGCYQHTLDKLKSLRAAERMKGEA